MSKLRKGLLGAATAAGMLAVATIGGYEGIRTKPYYDSVHVLTVCRGETKGVKLSDNYTVAECDAMFLKRLDEFADGVEKCVKRPMSSKTEVAFVSLSYNIGIAGFCKSSVVRLYNAGHSVRACDAMLNFNRAGGKVLKGLTTRRESENKLCIEGLG